MDTVPQDVINHIVAYLDVAPIFRWLRLCSKELFFTYLSNDKSISQISRAYCSLREPTETFTAPKNQRDALSMFACHHVPSDWLRKDPDSWKRGLSFFRKDISCNYMVPKDATPGAQPYKLWKLTIRFEDRVRHYETISTSTYINSDRHVFVHPKVGNSLRDQEYLHLSSFQSLSRRNSRDLYHFLFCHVHGASRCGEVAGVGNPPPLLLR
jgi:hypothetical protein